MPEKKQNRLSTAVRKKLFIEALEKALGVVYSACRSTGIQRRMHYYWMANDEKYRQQVEEIKNITLDFVESKLHKNIDKGDTASIIFYLKTQGKVRGYVERIEQTGKDGAPLIPKAPVPIVVMSPEDYARLQEEEKTQG